MDNITQILYWISTGLLIPVIVLLLIFFLRALILTGTFYGMYIQKLKFNNNFKQKLDVLTKDNIEQEIDALPGKSKLLIQIYLKKLFTVTRTNIHIEKVLTDFEIACQKDMSGSQTLTKLGAILGLMGTLIPMGPALVGLSSGNIESMAANMQVAFATTVIGLFTGAVGFIILQIKRRWYAADISNIEFMARLLKETSTVQIVDNKIPIYE